MSKDYKAASKRTNNDNRGSGTLMMGILIGLVLGLAIALAVAWYINKIPSPFAGRAATPTGDAPVPGAPSAPKTDAAPTAPSKPRFDFYKILPGAEEPMTEQQLKEAQRKGAVADKEVFLLQAGAFQNAPDADSLKARLALLGIEAAIQTATTPDKGTWYRVRTGPYAGIDELNTARANLKQNGIETTLIRVREAPASKSP
jgi:cell division protein FtsN